MLDRAVQPAFNKSSAFSLLHPETIILANGLPVTVVRGGEQDVAKIEFVFTAGKWHEAHPGVSYFMAHLLQKGTATKNSYQISAETEQLGVHFEVTPGHDFTSLALYGLTKNIGQVLALTREIITAPVFPQHELDQTKAIYLQGLTINLEKTSFLASRALRKNLFGVTHPYGRDAEKQDIETIEQVWLVDFHKQWLGSFQIICSGKITDALVQQLSTMFGTVPLSPLATAPTFSAQPQLRYEGIAKADSVQAS
jgi:zinc protease